MTKPDQKTILELLDFAATLADGAREIALNYHRLPKKQWTKSDDTFVTEVDLEIETFLHAQISNRYPHHGFFGEEFGDRSEERRYTWCIDPIDGTEPFVFGLPTFGVLIALTLDSHPIVGVIESPAMKERWRGATGFETTWQNKPCFTNGNARLEDAVVLATSIDMFSKDEKIIFDAVTSHAKRRRFGADCYAYGLLSCGSIDVVMESDMKPYDMMALVPVVKGANGMISDWEGNSLTLNSGRQVLASANPELHQECLDAIARCSV